MDKTAESEIIDYLYERMVALMMPISHMPQTFVAFASPLFKPNHSVASIIAFDKPEFERVIRLLVAYEFQSKKGKIGFPLAKRSYADAIRRASNVHSKLCKNNYGLCEFYNFMLSIKEDYIAYLVIDARVINSEALFNEERDSIEFSVGLAGFDIMRPDNRRMEGQELNAVRRRWEIMCADRGYYSDFSPLIGKANANANIFAMDYTMRLFRGKTA